MATVERVEEWLCAVRYALPDFSASADSAAAHNALDNVAALARTIVHNVEKARDAERARADAAEANLGREQAWRKEWETKALERGALLDERTKEWRAEKNRADELEKECRQHDEAYRRSAERQMALEQENKRLAERVAELGKALERYANPRCQREECKRERERVDYLEGALADRTKSYQAALKQTEFAEARLKDVVARCDRAERAILRAGYTDKGGEEWRPPLGPSTSPLLAQIDRERTSAEAWRKRCEKAADALADVLPGEAGRLDLVARIGALRSQCETWRKGFHDLASVERTESERLTTQAENISALQRELSAAQETIRRLIASGEVMSAHVDKKAGDGTIDAAQHYATGWDDGVGDAATACDAALTKGWDDGVEATRAACLDAAQGALSALGITDRYSQGMLKAALEGAAP